jgi:hypothetical protein
MLTELQYFNGRQACIDAVAAQPQHHFLNVHQERTRARFVAFATGILARDAENIWNTASLTEELLGFINYFFHTQGGRVNDKVKLSTLYYIAYSLFSLARVFCLDRVGPPHNLSRPPKKNVSYSCRLKLQQPTRSIQNSTYATTTCLQRTKPALLIG